MFSLGCMVVTPDINGMSLFFAGELIGRCEEGRSPGLPGKCEGDHSTGAGLHLHPAHPSQGPQGGSSMADIDHAPEIIRVLVRKSAN